MIDDLKSNYYKTTPADLKLNMTKMNTPHNTNRPFETIIEQIKTAVDFSDAGKVPYTPGQVVTMSYDLIFVTGYFTDTCLVWKKKMTVKKLGGVQDLLRQGTLCMEGHASHVRRGGILKRKFPRGGKKYRIRNYR